MDSAKESETVLDSANWKESAMETHLELKMASERETQKVR